MPSRRRTAALSLGWLLLTVVAVVVAWQGVGVVTDEVVGERPRDLSAADVRDALAAQSSTSSSAGSASTTTQATTPSSSSTSSVVTSSTSTTAPASIVRTYTLVGGSVQVRFSPTAVTVVYARPNPGFQTDVDQESPTAVRVELEGEDHKSRLDAFWSGGPQDEVREEGDDDD